MTRLSNLSRSVAGRVAIITGAGSGMGRATARLFADEGVKVALVDRDRNGVDEVEADITRAHGPGAAVGFVADITDSPTLATMVEATVTAFGGLDFLVNNAGISSGTRLNARSGEFEPDDFEPTWDRVLAVNLTSYVRLVRLALPHLRRSDAGRIVNIASTEAIVATPGLSAYSASKAGVAGLTRSLAVELGPLGITVNCICPGPVNTGMTRSIPDDIKQKYARRHVALRRYGEPEEIAHMTLSICLPAMSFLTGATIPVDGGMTIRHT